MSSADAMGWSLLVGTGWLTGFLSGLLGIGGGLVIVPALIFGLPLVGVSGDELAKVAIATSLVLIIPTSLAGGYAKQSGARKKSMSIFVSWTASEPPTKGA